MFGYQYAAAGLDGAQGFLERWLSPGFSTFIILVFFIVLLSWMRSAGEDLVTRLTGIQNPWSPGSRAVNIKGPARWIIWIEGTIGWLLIGYVLAWLYHASTREEIFWSIVGYILFVPAGLFLLNWWMTKDTPINPDFNPRPASLLDRVKSLYFGAGLAAFIAALLVYAAGSLGNALAELLVTLAVPALAAYLLYRFFVRGRPAAEGPARRRRPPWPPLGPPGFTTFGDAQLANPAIHAQGMKDILGGAKGIWFGQIQGSDREASYVGDRHLLTVAPNRTGKGVSAIIPNLLMDEEHSIICIDPKGQNAAVTARARRIGGRPVCCLNPFGEHTSAPWHLPMHGFNPLSGMSIDDPNVEADVAALAEAIIITESTTNPYFDNSARDLIEVLILHALATKGNKATLLDMRAWLGQPMEAADGRPSLLNTIVVMTNSEYPFIREMAARFLANTKSVNEIVQTATNQTKFLSHRAIATCLSGNDFRMIDFKNHMGTLYVILPERYLDAYSRFLRLVVVSALNALRSRPGGVKTIILMDEFARLGSLAAVEQAVGSSAGFNVQLWPFVQDLNQLQHLYPKRWDSFIANAGVVQWFTPNDSTTARYLSGRVGKTTVTNTTLNRQASSGQTVGGGGPGRSIGETTSANESDLGVEFLSPQNLYDMPQGLQLLTLAGLSYPVCATREPYFAVSGLMGEALKERADPDPFHL